VFWLAAPDGLWSHRRRFPHGVASATLLSELGIEAGSADRVGPQIRSPPDSRATVPTTAGSRPDRSRTGLQLRQICAALHRRLTGDVVGTAR
jgi:hypothetical protein